MLAGPLPPRGPGSPSGIREGDPRAAEPSGCLWVQEKSRLVLIEVKTVSCHFGRRAPPRPPMDPRAGQRPRRPDDCPFGPGPGSPGSPESPAPRAWGPRVLREATNRGAGPPAQPRPREQEKRKAASQEREVKDTERKRRKAGVGGRSPPARPEPPGPEPPGPGWAPWRLAWPRPSGRTPRPSAVQPRGGPGAWGWGRPPGPPSYEAHLLLRGPAGPPPRRRRPPRPDRPPPYVPPPSYHGPHRTLAGPPRKPDPRLSRDGLGAGTGRPRVGPKPPAPGDPAPARRDRPGAEPGARRGGGGGGSGVPPRPLPRARPGPADRGRAARPPRAWAPGPGGRPPRYSQTLPRPWAPGGTGGPGGPRGREPRRPHTLPRAPGRPRGPDGVFVIDATCVVIRAQYIPPPRARRIPPPGPPRTPGPPEPAARRPPRTEEAEAGPAGEAGAAFPSPGPRPLQSGRPPRPAGGGCCPEGCPAEAAPAERAARPSGLPAGPGRRLPGPGPYGGALREAVSRIRRHTAPDSDSDEGPERAAPGNSSDGSDTEPAGRGTGDTEARGGHIPHGLSRTEEGCLGPAAAGPAPEGRGKPH
ncbi:dendrin [Tachyglossus aculeatus]|uniref:dendrin n=1 Tax=Tachyglossus aculeatus TaxID=9261 RepID=UPI0018F2E399|nr:dendrin [Tachyglossus aculeatus]